ncbi:MAG: COG4223 family protein [Sphingomonadales bacterium]
MSTQNEFREQVEAFLKRHQFGAATLGSQALKDPKFVSDLRRGRSPSLKTIDRVRAWMAAYDAEHGGDQGGDQGRPELSKPRSSRFRSRLFGVVAALAVVAVLAGATVSFWPDVKSWLGPVVAWFSDSSDAENDIADHARRLVELEGRLAATQKRLEEMERSVRNSAQNARPGPADATLTDFNARLSALEHAPAAGGTALALEPVQAELARLGVATDEIYVRLEDLEQSGFGGYEGTTLLLAFGRLENAVASGRPFREPLAYFTTLLSGRLDDAQRRTALDVLTARAGIGVAGLKALKARFPDMAREVMRAAAIPRDAGWVDETIARLGMLITITPRGDNSGNQPAVVLARAAAFLEAGEPGQAASALEPLVEDAAEAAAAWRRDARALAAIQDALATLETLLYEDLSRATASGDRPEQGVPAQ